MGTIGKSVVIKGDLKAQEDLTIEGRVNGKVELDHNVLTIGENGKLQAEALAKVVVVMGNVTGNITATETISVRETASVEGDLVAPKVGISEGASFRGTIDMRPAKTPKGTLANKSTNREARQPAVA
jgi:cytoskeletal protein CcmA (bactofilin family)